MAQNYVKAKDVKVGNVLKTNTLLTMVVAGIRVVDDVVVLGFKDGLGGAVTFMVPADQDMVVIS